MRTSSDFNQFYSVSDPWQVTRANFRDRVFRTRIAPTVRGHRILELGCGEGHLTKAVFADAKSITGLDISDVAIDRAKSKNIANAHFEAADFLGFSFENYDVIAALECIYYLSDDEQRVFFDKIAREHKGKLLLLSGPIIGQGEHRRYFTHTELCATFARIGAVAKFHNAIINRRGFVSTVVAAAVRIPGFLWLLDLVPEAYIFQRIYLVTL